MKNLPVFISQRDPDETAGRGHSRGHRPAPRRAAERMRAPVARSLRGAARARARERRRGQEEEDKSCAVAVGKNADRLFFFFDPPIMSLNRLWLLQRTQRYNSQ